MIHVCARLIGVHKYGLHCDAHWMIGETRRMVDTSSSHFWIGKDFMYWCIADANANGGRKLNYTLIIHQGCLHTT